MKTVLASSASEAAEFIKLGGLVAFPTETVYGLGADVFDSEAIEKVFAAKGRPSDNPLIAHIGKIEDIEKLASEITPCARKLIEAFFPGPLTIVLPKAETVPLIATAGLDTIGIRMPRHEQANEFLKACGVPLVAPSANLSGRPSPTTWQAVAEDLDGRIDCILMGEPADFGLESTVVDCTGEYPLVLRAGAVSLEQLQTIEPLTLTHIPGLTESPRSPGLKHRHYSPSAGVVLVDSPEEAESGKMNAYIGLTAIEKDACGLVSICPSIEDYAHLLFSFFRECDHHGIKTIFCQRVEEKGIGLALMDRIKRACQA